MSNTSLSNQTDKDPKFLSGVKKLEYLASKNTNLPKTPNEFGEISFDDKGKLRNTLLKLSKPYKLGKFIAIASIVSIVVSFILCFDIAMNSLQAEGLLTAFFYFIMLVLFPSTSLAISKDIIKEGSREFDMSVNKKIEFTEDSLVYSYSTLDTRKLKRGFPKGNFIEYTIPYKGIDKIYFDASLKKYRINFTKGNVKVYTEYNQRSQNSKKTYFVQYLPKDRLEIIDSFSDENLFNKLLQKCDADSIVSELEITPRKLQSVSRPFAIFGYSFLSFLLLGIMYILAFFLFSMIFV